MEDDSIELNTLNDNEHNARLDKKKSVLQQKKSSNVLKTIKKTKSEKATGQKKLEKTLKYASESKKLEKVNENDNDNENVNRKNERKDFDHFNSFDRTHFTKTSTSSSSSFANKQAKFSSLFKNNHEIPKIGDVQAKSTVKESLFSNKSFSALNLSAHLTDCLEKRFNLKEMTQIQDKAIPAILSGQDCFIKSQTGSGKTLAYAVPIIQKLQAIEPKLKRNDGIKALVLVPTRELAIQTCQVFEQLCKACIWIVPGSLIGGMKKKAEKDRIRRGMNVLIATPGRLCDHLDTTLALDLSKVDYLIFDEADRMLDLDFEKKINFIIFKLHSAKKKALNEPDIPKFKLDENGEPIEDPSALLNDSNKTLTKRIDPQTILISATLTTGIKEIARRLNINDAVSIDAASSVNEKPLSRQHKSEEDIVFDQKDKIEQEKIALPANLAHFYMIVPSKLRLIGLISFLLDKLVYKGDSAKMIIFASTNDSVQFHTTLLNTFLNRQFNMYLDEDEFDYGSDLDDEEIGKKRKLNNSSNKSNQNKVCDLFALYGNMDQHERTEILSKFCKATSGVLLCTDVAARGLDMPNIDWIIQYNTPGTCVDYVHRVGRTARVGHKGKALIFLEPCESEYLNELNRLQISLKEVKLNIVMNCLMEESRYYPRQVNSDRLVFAKNPEECANSIQFYIEEYVEKSNDVSTQARKAYISFIRSYSSYSSDMKKIFHVKNLHIGHVAKSFGLREAPKDVLRNDLKTTTSMKTDRFKSRERNNEFRNEKFNDAGKKFPSRFDQNKESSGSKSFDLSGLLKNYKNVSEYSSGLPEAMKHKEMSNAPSWSSKPVTTTKHGPNKTTSNLMNQKRQAKSQRLANLKPKDNKKVNIIKKNMDIFD